MGNEIDYYFGAYLKIVVDEIKYQKLEKQCENGHKSPGPYCPKCGAAVVDVEVTASLRPTQVYELLGQEFDDHMSVITPSDLDATGVILAVGNKSTAGQWMYLPTRRGKGETVKPFPTDQEVAALKADLAKQYSKEIVALKASTIVKSVTVEAGFVLDEEY